MMMTKFPVPQSTEQGTKIDWHGCVRWQKKRGQRLWLWRSQKSMFIARFTNFRFFVCSVAVVFRFPRLSNSPTNLLSFNRLTDLICVVPVCLLRLSSAIQCSAHRDRPRPRSGELCAQRRRPTKNNSLAILTRKRRWFELRNACAWQMFMLGHRATFVISRDARIETKKKKCINSNDDKCPQHTATPTTSHSGFFFYLLMLHRPISNSFSLVVSAMISVLAYCYCRIGIRLHILQFFVVRSSTSLLRRRQEQNCDFTKSETMKRNCVWAKHFCFVCTFQWINSFQLFLFYGNFLTKAR